METKRQTRKIGVAGGFINQMMGNNSTTPVVGQGATILMYSDREAYEVISVSDDGNSCVIRKMDTTFIGSGYGDERYTYHSNADNYTMTLEWNSKKKKWGHVFYTIEIIKALRNRLFKEYGFDWSEHLPNGYTYNDLMTENDDFYGRNLKLVDGITKRYKNFKPVSVIFGIMEKYRDPHF